MHYRACDPIAAGTSHQCPWHDRGRLTPTARNDETGGTPRPPANEPKMTVMPAANATRRANRELSAPTKSLPNNDRQTGLTTTAALPRGSRLHHQVQP
jgi:hypothetical protein